MFGHMFALDLLDEECAKNTLLQKAMRLPLVAKCCHSDGLILHVLFKAGEIEVAPLPVFF